MSGSNSNLSLADQLRFRAHACPLPEDRALLLESAKELKKPHMSPEEAAALAALLAWGSRSTYENLRKVDAAVDALRASRKPTPRWTMRMVGR